MAAIPVMAQDYPNRTITIVVPFAAGGPTDALARQLATIFQAKLGHNVIVENVSGGASTIGTGRVARAAPDGYTLLVHNLAISANVSLHKLPFDPAKDLVTVGYVQHNPLLLSGRTSLPAKTFAELVPWLKSETGRFATPGAGSTGHLASALFAQALGIKWDHIPYRGGAPALQDVIGGHVDFFFGTPQQLLEPFRGGLIKIYGTTAKEPSPLLAGVPSFVQTHGPKLEIPFWHALFAPAGTPRPIVDKLNATLQQVLDDPAIVKSWADTGVDIYPKEQRSPEAGHAILVSEIKRWGDVIRDNKIEAGQ
jgi:tripartite-type tricarboxylate transporter receptor subunit TctC